MAQSTPYRSTESKYKGGAQEMYVTYDIRQATRSGKMTTYPKVKRVYIAGDVKKVKTGDVKKRSGREVRGVLINYEQDRSSANRRAFTAQRGQTKYDVKQAHVHSSRQTFTQVVEIPEDAKSVHFYKNSKQLPAKYKSALQNVK
jgi:hypothetical protein